MRTSPDPEIASTKCEQSSHRLVATSAPISRNRTIAGLLGAFPARLSGETGDPSGTIVGWGFKRSGKRALALKGRFADHWLLEDGFLRSVGRRDDPLGISFDKDGIYYAANSPSLLFDQITRELTTEQQQRTRDLIALWRANRVSKYNDAPPLTAELPARYVLVVDQVRDDQSISYGLAKAETFDVMLNSALAENPGVPVVVKIHPDSVARPEKRHFDLGKLADDTRIIVAAEPAHIVDLIEHAQLVYTVTSQVGFEALIWAKRVRTFGMPFYAGWGLTEDEMPPPVSRHAVTLEQLVHAALISYPRYWHPVREQQATPEETIRLVGINRRNRENPSDTIYAVGFSRWKKPFLRQFLSGADVVFVKDFAKVPKGATLLVWGRREVPNAEQFQILRAEDGFLRSSGLGADLVRPLSLVIDDLGIYFDSTRPSRLETILSSHGFTDEERAEAGELREAVIAARLSKYNLGGSTWGRPDIDKRVILVVGQVETDASIRFGSPEVRSNLELVRRVRAEHPDDYLVYKPHPDVVAGLRGEGEDEQLASEICDEVVTDANTVQMLDEVDAVHTITSLLGFEALLRGVPVTCHGQPFYSGWGLTEDKCPVERRGRQLKLDELTYGALIAYPRYFSQRAGLFASARDILHELSDLAERGPQTRTLPRKILHTAIVSWRSLRRRLGFNF